MTGFAIAPTCGPAAACQPPNVTANSVCIHPARPAAPLRQIGRVADLQSVRPVWRPRPAVSWRPNQIGGMTSVTVKSMYWAQDDRADFDNDPSFQMDLSVLAQRAQQVREKEEAGVELDAPELPDIEQEEDPLLGLDQVYVLLVHAGTDNEGIYSLKMGASDIILAFEAEEEAMRYATLLEAQDFPTPSVESFKPDEIRLFCEESGHRMGLVPPGSLFMPPEESAIDPAWKEGGPKDAGDKRRAERSAAQQAELDEARTRLERLLGFGGENEGPTSA